MLHDSATDDASRQCYTTELHNCATDGPQDSANTTGLQDGAKRWCYPRLLRNGTWQYCDTMVIHGSARRWSCNRYGEPIDPTQWHRTCAVAPHMCLLMTYGAIWSTTQCHTVVLRGHMVLHSAMTCCVVTHGTAQGFTVHTELCMVEPVRRILWPVYGTST